jgi:hypothetical protein
MKKKKNQNKRRGNPWYWANQFWEIEWVEFWLKFVIKSV